MVQGFAQIAVFFAIVLAARAVPGALHGARVLR